MGNRSIISLVGNTTTGQNLGTGACVFKGKSGGNNLQFRTISATGASIQIYQVGNKILVSGATGGGGGTLTTVSNGLTAYGSNAVLGGTLTGSTAININQKDISISGTYAYLAMEDLSIGSVGLYMLNGANTGWGFIAHTGGTNLHAWNVTKEAKIELIADSNPNPAIYVCGSTGFKGVEYCQDYCLNYSNRSLVDKGYVDSIAFSGATPYTFIPSGGTIIKTAGSNITIYSSTGGTGGGTITGGTNGLGTNGANITLGGTLTGNTIIGLCNKVLDISGTGGFISRFDNSVLDSIQFITSANTNVQITGFNHSISLDSTVGPSVTINGNSDGVLLSTTTANIQISGIPDRIQLSTDAGSGIDIHGTGATTGINISGPVRLVTTPASGAASKTALLWDSGTTLVKGVPVIDEWVGSTVELLYAGQKFAYPTQTILQTDVSTCVTIPNQILIQNICLKNVGDTVAFSIPAGKTAMLNRAKLIILCDSDPTGFKISMGNNYCANPSLSYNNLVNLQDIQDVLTNETYELNLVQQGVTQASGSIVYFRVESGSTNANNLCAHLLVEGFVY